MKALKRLMMASAFAMLTTGMALAADGLFVGDKTPVVKVGGWVKGTPVTTFKKGDIYVVEFWATWCGPCRESIPHLTEMAKKYAGKVTFTGVSVFERDPAYATKVKKFVDDMGAKMDYHVAYDDAPTAEGTMASKWMTAAKQPGIPTAFIVNKEGLIAWIGHPMEMEKPLEAVVKGTWDLKAETAKFRANIAKETARQETMKAIGEAFLAKKYDVVLKIVDTETAKNPEMKDELASYKFRALFESDRPKAMAMAKASAKTNVSPNLLFTMAQTIANHTGLNKEDYELVAPLFDTISENVKQQIPMFEGIKATAYINAGDKVKAKECLEKGIKMATDQKADRLVEQFKKQIADLKL